MSKISKGGILFGFSFLLLTGCAILDQSAEGLQQDWEEDIRLTFDQASTQLSFNFAWSVAADDEGGVHVVWYESGDSPSRIFYKRSTDGGTTWEQEIELAENPTGSEHPSIAASGRKIYVVWHEFHPRGSSIAFRRSTDRGSSWGDVMTLSASGASAHTSIAADGPHVQIVWGDTRSGNAEIYTRRSDDGGLNWDLEYRITDEPFESRVPSVAISEDDVFAAWVDYGDANEEEYFRRSLDGGSTWQPIARLTNNEADSWAPSIAVEGDFVHYVWFDRRDSEVSDEAVESIVDDAMLILGLPMQPAPSRDPSVYYLPPFQARIQDKMQRIQQAAPRWVADGGDPKLLEKIFQEFEEAIQLWAQSWEIYYKQSQDRGITWGPDTRLTNAPGNSARPSIAVEGENVYIVWFDGRDGNTEIYFKHSSDGGMTWEPDVRLTTAEGESLHPTIAVSETALHVVWYDQRDGNPEIYYKRKLIGELPQFNQKITPKVSLSILIPKEAFDE